MAVSVGHLPFWGASQHLPFWGGDPLATVLTFSGRKWMVILRQNFRTGASYVICLFIHFHGQKCPSESVVLAGPGKQ